MMLAKIVREGVVNMKIIGLLPFKNEAWCLPSYLNTMCKVCDEIIAVDDGSIDEGRQILEDAGVEVHDNKERDVSAWAEHHIRQKLLHLGRSAGGTHFICLDADETFTSNLVPKLRKGISRLEPGHKMRLHWLPMWKSLYHYRDDNSPWSKSFKDFIFCDDHKMEYPYAWLHVGRTPGENTPTNHILVPEGKGGVFHWQFSDWERFQIKQCWLRCSELIKYPDQTNHINQKYRITLDDPNTFVKAVPEDWMKNIVLPDLNHDRIDWKWRLEEILKWFEQYGQNYFAGLEIKQLQPIINKYYKNFRK
jgi:glycosyltransferase involved in cell wall biosynthesis